MRIILILLCLCISAATSRPSQTDDDDGETEYEAGDDNQRSYDDEAEETEDYSEPDSEDPAIKSNRQFVRDQKTNNKDELSDDHNGVSGKEENKKCNMNKRTSNKKDSEPTPDVTLKEKLLKKYRDQNSDNFDVKEEVQNDKVSLSHEHSAKLPEKKLDNLYDRNRRESEYSSDSGEKDSKIHSKRDANGVFESSESVYKSNNNKDLTRKDLEDLLSSLSIEKINILKSLINNNENIAKRDIAKKSNAVDGDKSTGDSRINVRENQEKCHSSIPSPCDSEIPHNIHSISTCPPSGCDIKIPKPCDMCNLTTPHAEISDTGANQEETQSKEIKYIDDGLTDIIDAKNEDNKESMSDLENIANLESFYDFSEHHNNFKGNENSHTDDYSEFQNYESKLLKRETSRDKHGASMDPLEDSFPKAYEKFNIDSDLEPLVRVKRTEGQNYETENLKSTCENTPVDKIENINIATDKISIGSDTDNILSNNEEVESTIMTDKSRSKRAEDKMFVREFDTCDTNLGYDKLNLGDNDKLALINKESDSQDAEVDDLENMTQLKDVGRYKRVRQVNEETRNI